MKFSSLFKSQKKSSFAPLLCRLPHCGNPKTLSFRVENNHNIFNSQRFYNNIDDYMVEKVIEGLKIEKDRFFFEAGGKTSSILEVSSSTLSKSNISTSGNGLEFLPFNDSCDKDPMDPYGEETSSILEVSSSTFSKSNNSTSSNGLEVLPFNDSCVMNSMDPYGEETSSILEVSSSALSKSNISTSGNGLEFLPFNDSCDKDPMDPYGEETSSILEVSSSTFSKSNNSTSSNGLEVLPFNDSCVMNSMDPYGEETSSILEVMSSPTLSKSNNSTSSNGLEVLPFNHSYVMDSMDPYGEETSSILEVSSSTFSKSNNSTSSNGLEVLPFNDSCVIRLSSERDLYESFKGSMVRMIEAKKGKKDWEEYIEEILEWYLVINEKNIHKYIIGAFCDLWMYYASTSRTYTPISFTNSPFSFSFDVPPSPSFLALVEAKADQIIATTTTTSSVIS